MINIIEYDLNNTIELNSLIFHYHRLKMKPKSKGNKVSIIFNSNSNYDTYFDTISKLPKLVISNTNDLSEVKSGEDYYNVIINPSEKVRDLLKDTDSLNFLQEDKINIILVYMMYKPKILLTIEGRKYIKPIDINFALRMRYRFTYKEVPKRLLEIYGQLMEVRID